MQSRRMESDTTADEEAQERAPVDAERTASATTTYVEAKERTPVVAERTESATTAAHHHEEAQELADGEEAH